MNGLYFKKQTHWVGTSLSVKLITSGIPPSPLTVSTLKNDRHDALEGVRYLPNTGTCDGEVKRSERNDVKRRYRPLGQHDITKLTRVDVRGRGNDHRVGERLVNLDEDATVDACGGCQLLQGKCQWDRVRD